MGLIHIYCGDGKGKTTASVGLAVRAVGSGKKVLFSQFFKNGESSEVKAIKTFENLTYCKSDKAFPRFANMTDEDKLYAYEYYDKLVNDIIEKAKNYDMIVFDEIISCYNLGFLNRETVVNFCKNNDYDIEIVLTGRNPAPELVEIADYVSQIEKIKHPYDQGITARKGIEY
ncbi:MAG: cob(I)yrinic acid a,c-diamide adenosyltransferase [Clostridia bacterium]